MSCLSDENLAADYPRLPPSPLDYRHRTRQNAILCDSLRKQAFRVSSCQQKTFRLFGVADAALHNPKVPGSSPGAASLSLPRGYKRFWCASRHRPTPAGAIKNRMCDPSVCATAQITITPRSPKWHARTPGGPGPGRRCPLWRSTSSSSRWTHDRPSPGPRVEARRL